MDIRRINVERVKCPFSTDFRSWSPVFQNYVFVLVFIIANLIVPLPGRSQPVDIDALNVYFGNLHSHTSYSDGSGTPALAYAHARDDGGLDFLAITEHNHPKAEFGIREGDPRKDGVLIATSPHLYHGKIETVAGMETLEAALIPTAEKFNEDGKFVAIYGQEFSSIGSGNHVNVFEVPEVIDAPNGKFGKLREWIAEDAHKDSSGKVALLQFNHPNLKGPALDHKEYGRDDFGSFAEWRKQMDGVAQLIEIMNGPSTTQDHVRRAAEYAEGEYLRYLRLGFHLAPTGDQDNHFHTWGTATDVRTGIIAEELTKSNVLNALRNRHVYATEDKNLRLIATVNGHLCGDRISAPSVDSELTIELKIVDDDEPGQEYDVDVFLGTIGGDEAEVAETFVADGNGTFTLEDIHYEGGHQYVFLRITQRVDEHGENDRAWTSPVWLEPDSETPSQPEVDISTFVASKNSRIYHSDPNCKFATWIKDSNKLFGSEAVQGRDPHAGCPKH